MWFLLLLNLFWCNGLFNNKLDEHRIVHQLYTHYTKHAFNEQSRSNTVVSAMPTARHALTAVHGLAGPAASWLQSPITNTPQRQEENDTHIKESHMMRHGRIVYNVQRFVRDVVREMRCVSNAFAKKIYTRKKNHNSQVAHLFRLPPLGLCVANRKFYSLHPANLASSSF